MCIASVPVAMGKPSIIGQKYHTSIQVQFPTCKLQLNTWKVNVKQIVISLYIPARTQIPLKVSLRVKTYRETNLIFSSLPDGVAS